MTSVTDLEEWGDDALDTSTKCENCGGNGWKAQRNSLLGPGLYEVVCDHCNGFGWIEGPEGSRPWPTYPQRTPIMADLTFRPFARLSLDELQKEREHWAKIVCDQWAPMSARRTADRHKQRCDEFLRSVRNG